MDENKKSIFTKLKEFWQDDDKGQATIVFLSLAIVMLLAFIGFFSWHTARMRSYELEHVIIKGTVVDVEKERHTDGSSGAGHGSSHTYYYFVIEYTYENQEYRFTDRVGHKSDVSDQIGKWTKIYVDPNDPSSAEMVTSAGFVSIICACFFAFFCVMYSAGMNFFLSLKGTSFKKRLAFVWGIEVLLGTMFLLLFWLGLPKSGFDEVFTRIEGAVGVTVITGFVLFATILDAIISCKLRPINRIHDTSDDD